MFLSVVGVCIMLTGCSSKVDNEAIEKGMKYIDTIKAKEYFNWAIMVEPNNTSNIYVYSETITENSGVEHIGRVISRATGKRLAGVKQTEVTEKEASLKTT